MTLTYYLQPCPTCGRRLQVRIEYLGKQLACSHCQGAFIASDPDLKNDSQENCDMDVVSVVRGVSEGTSQFRGTVKV